MCSSDLKKMWHIYTMEYYSAIKRNEIMPFAATWMQLEIIMQSKSERERQIPYDVTYIWNLKHGTDESIYKTEIDSQTQRTDLWLPRGRTGGRGIDWEFGVGRCKLLYIGWINNKVLLCSTGN